MLFLCRPYSSFWADAHAGETMMSVSSLHLCSAVCTTCHCSGHETVILLSSAARWRYPYSAASMHLWKCPAKPVFHKANYEWLTLQSCTKMLRWQTKLHQSCSGKHPLSEIRANYLWTWEVLILRDIMEDISSQCCHGITLEQLQHGWLHKGSLLGILILNSTW